MGLLKDIWKNRALIAEGLRNRYFPPEELKQLIRDTEIERKDICDQCPFMSTNAKILFSYQTMRLDKHCTKCGCNIDLKVSSLDSACPDNPSRWEAVVSEDDFTHIQQTIQHEEQQGSSKEHQSITTSGDIKEV